MRKKHFRNYRWRYWKRKKTMLDTPVILLLAGLSVLSWIFSVSVNEKLDWASSGLLFTVITVAIVGLAISPLVLWKNYYRWKKIRALRLSNIDNMTGIEFEKYIANLFIDRGYNVKLTPINDYGADLIAHKKNKHYVVQMKRYKGQVGLEAVQQVVAAKLYYNANKAAVITNSYFTHQAQKLAESNEVTLINRDTLAKWILNFSTKETGNQ